MSALYEPGSAAALLQQPVVVCEFCSQLAVDE